MKMMNAHEAKRKLSVVLAQVNSPGNACLGACPRRGARHGVLANGRVTRRN